MQPLVAGVLGDALGKYKRVAKEPFHQRIYKHEFPRGGFRNHHTRRHLLEYCFQATSLQLHLRPYLIDRSKMVDDVFPNPFSAELRPFSQYAERRRDTAKVTGTMGNPLVASAEKGRQVFEAAVRRLVMLATEMHDLPVRHYKEFGSHCP